MIDQTPASAARPPFSLPPAASHAIFGDLAALTVSELLSMAQEHMEPARRKPSNHIVQPLHGATHAWTDDSASRGERLSIDAKYLAIAHARRELTPLAALDLAVAAACPRLRG